MLYERNCTNCKHLSEYITCGGCEITNHKVISEKDNDFAEKCDLYENKYGYKESDNCIKK